VAESSVPILRSQQLLLARHGETVENAAHLIIGQRDPPLSDVGREQATALAQATVGEGVAALWCSPLLRASQTAAVVGELIGVVPTVLEGLIESDRGEWAGQPIERIVRHSPGLFEDFVTARDDFAFPGGESLREQVVRTSDALDLIARGALPALVVAHAGTIRAALIALHRPVPPERELMHGEIVRVAWPSSPPGARG
jgi:broad specificity phosphatase PhoE